MIHVLTVISYDNSLLKHFIQYYASLGVQSFFIAIDERVPGIWHTTETMATMLPVDIKLVPVSKRQKETGIEGNNKEEIRRKYISSNDWVIPADLDEFIEFPAPISQLIREMSIEQTTFINGRFSDRLSIDGSLTPTEEGPSIWEQYPLEAEVSARLVKCWCTKVTLARGDCVLTSGHHNVVFPCKPLITRKCVIHHFKWRHGLIEALNRRISIYNKAGAMNSIESERVVTYFKANGRIIPTDFNSKQGWNPSIKNAKKDKVLFTSITNRYDELKDFNNDICAECVAFTDFTSSSKCWQIQEAHNGYCDPCRNAKIHKILSHLYFPYAQYSLWIDGSISIKPDFDFDTLINTYLNKHDIAVFAHSSRKCAYSEAEACILKKKDDLDVIKRQMLRYKYESYPYNNGLAECAIVLRRHTESICEFNEVWWEEIKTHSRRDQLSFNYVAWKLRLKYRTMPGNVRDNAFFSFTPHAMRRDSLKSKYGT